MTLLSADVLPELLAPRGYVPAAEPFPLAAEPLFPIPLPGESIGLEGVPDAGPKLDALMHGILASSATARARMRWSDADTIAGLGAFLSVRAQDPAWARRFAAEAASASLLGGRAPVLPDDADPHAGDPRAAVNRAVAAGLSGDATGALGHLEAAEKGIDYGDEFTRLLVLVNRAQALLDLGDLDAAARDSAAALRLARREKRDHWIALASLGIALSALARGRRNEARSRLGEAARLFERFGDALRQIQCHFLLGEVAWIGEDPIRAGSHYRDALSVARRAEAQAWIELLTLRFEHR